MNFEIRIGGQAFAIAAETVAKHYARYYAEHYDENFDANFEAIAHDGHTLREWILNDMTWGELGIEESIPNDKIWPNDAEVIMIDE